MENTKSPSKKGELHVYFIIFKDIQSVIIEIFHEVLLSRNQIVLVLELCRTGPEYVRKGNLAHPLIFTTPPAAGSDLAE